MYLKHFTYKLLFTFLLSFLASVNCNAIEGDELIVTESLINVRSGPSSDTEVILKLKKDRKVTEIHRQNNWVEVNIDRDDIKSGWIHGSLLAKAETTTNSASPTRFDKFAQRLKDQNEVRDKQNNDIYFSEARNKGKGTIEIIATQAWLDLNYDKRSQTANELFKRWADIYGTGYSVSVLIFDELEQQHMVLIR